LFDHLVRTTKQRQWDSETKGLGGFEIDDQFGFRQLLIRPI
jgi:hypothetical protein